jgi:nucleolar protein 53
MATVADAPQQYKQPSRKGKKAWRKNVDVSEVQEGLEDLREEIIQGYYFPILRYQYMDIC